MIAQQQHQEIQESSNSEIEEEEELIHPLKRSLQARRQNLMRLITYWGDNARYISNAEARLLIVQKIKNWKWQLAKLPKSQFVHRVAG